jgi:hypothetical protein
MLKRSRQHGSKTKNTVKLLPRIALSQPAKTGVKIKRQARDSPLVIEPSTPQEKQMKERAHSPYHIFLQLSDRYKQEILRIFLMCPIPVLRIMFAFCKP